MFYRCSKMVFVFQRMLLIAIVLSIGAGAGFACGGMCCEDPLEAEHTPAETERCGCLSADLTGLRASRRGDHRVAVHVAPVDQHACPAKATLPQGFSFTLASDDHRLANGLCAPLRC